MTNTTSIKGPAQMPPWWADATVEELASSRKLVDAFLLATGAKAPNEVEMFARALALQVLCFRPETLADVVGFLQRKLGEFENEETLPEDTTHISSWLVRCDLIATGCRRCIELANPDEVGPLNATLTHTVLRAQFLNGDIESRHVAKGTSVPIKPLRTVRFPRRRRRGAL
jgi:hypothetical protein